MCIDYFVIFYLENLFSSLWQVYGIFAYCFTQATVWVGFLFLVLLTSVIERAYQVVTQFDILFLDEHAKQF